MPDKKVATQASDGPWERETIITFNDAEKKASYYTCNKARMEQLKELAKEYPDAVKITRDEDWCMEADMPKKWVKIKPPRKLTEEQKQSADANIDNAIDLLVENTSMIKRPIVEGQIDDKNQGQPILLCGFDEADFDKFFS